MLSFSDQNLLFQFFLIKTIEPDVEQEKLLDPAHLFELEHQDNEEQQKDNE
jgi:hypothetical protein